MHSLNHDSGRLCVRVCEWKTNSPKSVPRYSCFLLQGHVEVNVHTLLVVIQSTYIFVFSALCKIQRSDAPVHGQARGQGFGRRWRQHEMSQTQATRRQAIQHVRGWNNRQPGARGCMPRRTTAKSKRWRMNLQ